MIGGSEWLLKSRGTVLPNCQKPVRETAIVLKTNPVEALTDGFGDRRCHGLTGEPRQFYNEPIRLLVLDVQTHDLYLSTINL